MMDGSQDGRSAYLASSTATIFSRPTAESQTSIASSSSLQHPPYPPHSQQQQQQQHSGDGSSEFSPYFLVAAAAASAQAEAARAANEVPSGSTASSSTASDSKNGVKNRIGTSDLMPHPLPYLENETPFPMELGNRVTRPKGKVITKSRRSRSEEGPVKERCSWAILSTTTKRLSFMYVDPTFSRNLSSEACAIVGTSFFDYIHPEERDRAEIDMKNIIDSRTLFGSVTRCRYSRNHRIRKVLSAAHPTSAASNNEEAGHEEGDYLAIDIVVNWIGDDMALCFFHAIMDESLQDNDEVNKTAWSNWCGIQTGLYDQEECQNVWRSIKQDRSLSRSKTGPEYVFQILSAVPLQETQSSTAASSDILFSWPPPRLFPQPTKAATSSAAATNFADGSYFVDDFARLAQGVNLLTVKREVSDANTSCTRRFRAKHTLTSEGMIRSVESVLIPYGSIVLACFSVTFVQLLPNTSSAAVTVPSSTSANVMSTSTADDSDGSHILSNSFSKGGQQQRVTSVDVNLDKPNRQRIDGTTYPSRTNPLIDTPVDSSQDAPMPPHSSQTQNGIRSHAIGELEDGKTDIYGIHTRMNIAGEGDGGSVATLAAVAAAAAAQSKRCVSCGTGDSPEWRKGPDGSKSLCNACGLRYSRNISRARKREERALIAAEVAANGGIIPPHLRKNPGADIKKMTKKQKMLHDQERQDAAQNQETARETSLAISTTTATLTPHSSGLVSTPLQGSKVIDESHTSSSLDDESIRMARAAAQAAAAAGLRQL
ncbi:hypothetical protein CBS101457_005249 [Exobasidium rhododendri]|nr:hypothetical protein CBS101457_005249 [Exobasidium rhododendri]